MKHVFLRGCLAFIAGCLILLIIAALSAFAEAAPAVIRIAVSFLLYPLAGAVTAYVIRLNHVNNYLAWIPAPCAYPAGFYLVWGYLPGIGPMLAAMFIGIIGAATAETKLRFDARKE